MTCAAWVESLIIRNDGGRKTYRSCQKHLFLLFHDHLTGCHLSVFVSKKLEATWDTTQNNCIISRVQNTTALQPNLILTGYIPYWSQARTVDSPKRKSLPSSTTNSSVIINKRLLDR